MTEKVAVLGLGTMGGPMASHIAEAGFSTTGWNRNRNRPSAVAAADAGVSLADTIAAAVAEADVVVTCVSDVPDVHEVVLGDGGVAAHAVGNAVVVDCSTIGPVAARALAGEVGPRGFVDAPVTGGDVGARNGTLTTMVGGADSHVAVVRPVLDAFSAQVHHVGPVGSGQALKMVNQVLCAASTLGLAEAFALAGELDIDLETVVEVCGGGAAGSWSLSTLGPRIATDDLASGFSIANMRKDLGLVAELGETLGLDLALAALTDARLGEVADPQLGTHSVIQTY